MPVAQWDRPAAKLWLGGSTAVGRRKHMSKIRVWGRCEPASFGGLGHGAQVPKSYVGREPLIFLTLEDSPACIDEYRK